MMDGDRDYHELGDEDLRKRLAQTRQEAKPAEIIDVFCAICGKTKGVHDDGLVKGHDFQLAKEVGGVAQIANDYIPVGEKWEIGTQRGAPVLGRNPEMSYSQLLDGRQAFTFTLPAGLYDDMKMADRAVLLDNLTELFRTNLARMMSIQL